jgi:hypothetical protein
MAVPLFWLFIIRCFIWIDQWGNNAWLLTSDFRVNEVPLIGSRSVRSKEVAVDSLFPFYDILEFNCNGTKLHSSR